MTQAERKWEKDELELFQAGRDEVPPARSAEGVLAALGLDGPIGPGGGEDAPASGLGPVHPVPAPRPTSAPAASGIFARPLTWVGGGLMLALVPAAVILAGGETSREGPAQNSESLAAPESNGLGQASPPEGASKFEQQENAPAAQPAEPEAESPPASELNRHDVAHKKPFTAKSTSDTKEAEETATRPSLGEELAIIKRARDQLSAGNLQGAEAALAEHAQKFKPQRLSSEARVVRVEILMKQGKKSEARQLAAPLMKDNSPYRARMETLLSSP